MKQEKQKQKPPKKSTKMSDYEERKINAHPKYLTEGKKQYFLASSQETFQSLLDDQCDDLTRVLIELKSEHDRLTLDTKKTEAMIKEYDKRIEMLQGAVKKNEKDVEDQNDFKEGMTNDIYAKKSRKEEEKFNQKTLNKQIENLNRDISILQKQIAQYEKDAEMLNKKKERDKIKQNIINDKKNKEYSKDTNKNKKNQDNKGENDLKTQRQKIIIELKSSFLKFSDDRKEIQNKKAQKAKNDSKDQKEIEKREMLKLLMSYNQFLRITMEEQLKENENLENVFVQIRDICGTQDLQKLVDYVVLRYKRYKNECEEIKKLEDKKVELQKDLKSLKEEFTNLKNKLLAEEDENGNEIENSVPSSTKEEDELEIIRKEQESEEKLKEIEDKFNEIDTAYNFTLQNLKSMLNFEKKNPLDVKIDEEENEEEDEKKKEQKKENEKGENVENNIQNAEKKIEENDESEEDEKVGLKEEEIEVIKNYKLLLKKVMKTFDILYLCHNKQEFLNLMKEKGKKKESEEAKNSQVKTKRENLKIETKNNLGKSNDRKYHRTESYQIIAEDKVKEDDRSNNDPDKKISKKFTNEQKK